MTEKTETEKIDEILTYARKPETVALIKKAKDQRMLNVYLERYDAEEIPEVQRAFLGMVKNYIRNLKDSPVQTIARIKTLEEVEKLQESMKADLAKLKTTVQETYPLLSLLLNIPVNFNSRLKQLQTKHGLVGEENLAEALKHQKDQANKEATKEATK